MPSGRRHGRDTGAADCDSYYLHHRQLDQTDAPQAFELRLRKADTSVFTAWADIALAHDHNGTPMRRLVVTDISERKAIQEQLRESQSLLHAAGQMAQIGGWALSLPQQEISWSDELRTAYREQREAIAAVQAGDILFDLVITDYKMPGISGLELARAMRAQATAAGVRELFSKPHEEEDLRDAVQLPPPPRFAKHTPG